MSSIDKAALLIGRLFAVLGAGLLLLALTWPWITLRMDSPGLPEELRLSLSGGDVVALGAAYAAMTPNLDNLLGQMSQIEPQLSTDRTFRQIKRQIEAEREDAPLIAAWVAALWAPPVVVLVLALTLLITNGGLPFRRGFGGALMLVALLSLITLFLTRMGIERVLPALRANPGLADMFDALDSSRIDISLRADSGMTGALIFGALMLVGGLAELVLPLGAIARAFTSAPAPLQSPAPALQAVGLPVVDPVGAPFAGGEPARGQVACVQCGRSLVAGSRFCGGCGARQE
jgi:hypothetical protein